MSKTTKHVAFPLLQCAMFSVELKEHVLFYNHAFLLIFDHTSKPCDLNATGRPLAGIAAKQTAPTRMNNSAARPLSILVPVGNSGFYSEFLVEKHDSKAYIKQYFAPNKLHYSEIERAKEKRLVEQENVTIPPPQVQLKVRTSITIAELLNPLQE